jgi:6-phosphogluconolactonase
VSSPGPRTFPTVVSNESLVFFGTYTLRRSEGIYVYSWSSGDLEYHNKAVGVINPSYLAIDPGRRYLFAVNEVRDHDGRLGGGVSSFAIDRKTGKLTFLNQQPSLGGDPCYLTTDKTGRALLVANYASGTLAAIPVEGDGKLGSPTDFVQHIGPGNHPRNPGPHAHCVEVDPTNRYVLACDAGLDKVLIYRLDASRGALEPSETPCIDLDPGTGPRHITFHPNGKYAYVITESGATIVAYDYDSRRGTLEELHAVPTLPEGFQERNSCADIHVEPSGRFVYGSNRGHDSIVIYAIDEDTGKLSYVGHESTQGRSPRNFTIDPTGTFLLAANQRTDNIVTFRIDPQTGRLTPTGAVADVPTPVCIKFMPIY